MAYKHKKFSGIYLITNIVDNKKYVGQSVNITTRWNQHMENSTMIWKREYLYNSIRKHGLENFRFEILELCEADKLNEREIYWINEVGPTFNNIVPNGFDAKGKQKWKLKNREGATNENGI